jgi:hypothetical protein
MMRLVIEQVRKDLAAQLRARSSVHRAIGPRLFQLRVSEAFDVGDDPLILPLSRSRQRWEIVADNRIQLCWMLAGAGDPAHPDEVGAQDVIERAMQTLEVGANVPSILLVGQPARHRVQPAIRPRVVIGHECEVRFHAVTSAAKQAPLGLSNSARRNGCRAPAAAR